MTPGDPELFADAAAKVALEERNSYRLAKTVDRLARFLIRGNRTITPRIIRRFHRIAIRDIYSCAGRYRDWPVKITGSRHVPPRSGVEGLVGAMCETAREKVESGEWDPLQAAAYLLWRLNWIHPFGGGKGRTSRALAYLAICVYLGQVPEGHLSIAKQIDQDRDRYRATLEDADEAWKESSLIDVGMMKDLLVEFLVNQMRSAAWVPPSS